MRTEMGIEHGKCSLTVPRVGMNTTTRSQGGRTMQKRLTKLLRGDRYAVRSEEDGN